jgi:hypothetical protein
MTGLLIVATLFYGIISEILSEFTAPGGWSAKFIETAGKSIKYTDAVIRYKSLDVNFLQKGTHERQEAEKLSFLPKAGKKGSTAAGPGDRFHHPQEGSACVSLDCFPRARLRGRNDGGGSKRIML